MTIATRRTPERGNPFLSGPVLQKGTTVTKTLTTAGGAQTLTAAEILAGLIAVDTQDAQTLNTPTAALLNAGIPGVEVGTAFEFTVVNYGDSTLTIGLGTGVTITVIATVDAVLTLATLTSARFRLECTGVKNDFVPGTSDAWVLWHISGGADVVLS